MALVNEKEEEEDAEKALKGEFIEEEPAGLVSGIKIKHLAKVSSTTDTLTHRVNMSTDCYVQMVKVSQRKRGKRATTLLCAHTFLAQVMHINLL